jgi:hypothetical protein
MVDVGQRAAYRDCALEQRLTLATGRAVLESHAVARFTFGGH